MRRTIQLSTTSSALSFRDRRLVRIEQIKNKRLDDLAFEYARPIAKQSEAVDGPGLAGSAVNEFAVKASCGMESPQQFEHRKPGFMVGKPLESVKDLTGDNFLGGLRGEPVV